MSTYYLIVNFDLKEYLCSGCLGLGIHRYAYTHGLIGKLLPNLLETYGSPENGVPTRDKQYNNELPDYTQGHWAACYIGMISEYNCMYDKVKDYGEDSEWINITPPCVVNHNEYANEEHKIKLDVCNGHKDKSSNYWREKLK